MSVRLRNSKRRSEGDLSTSLAAGPPPLSGEASKVENFLKKSPINYFSDLFIIAMVVCWILVLLVMCIMAVYATVRYADVTIWSDIANLTGIPLSCGGAVWMIKNSVQHAIANNRGEQAKMDFPKVEEAEFSGKEEEAKG